MVAGPTTQQGSTVRRLEGLPFYVQRAPSLPSICHLTGSPLGKILSKWIRCTATPFLLTLLIPGIFTTRHLVLMHASDSREDRSQTTRRTRSWAPGTCTSLRGIRIASIFVALLARMRFVSFIPTGWPRLTFTVNR